MREICLLKALHACWISVTSDERDIPSQSSACLLDQCDLCPKFELNQGVLIDLDL
jgi:hypothetical protein